MLSNFCRRISSAHVIAWIALFVALSSGAYAVTIAPKNSVNSRSVVNESLTNKDVKNESLTNKDVKNDDLTGQDIRENTLGQVPSAASAGSAGSAGSATNAQNADTLDGVNSTGFLQPNSFVAGDLGGVFSNPQLQPGVVGPTEVLNDSLTNTDIGDYERTGISLVQPVDGTASQDIDAFGNFEVDATCTRSGSSLSATLRITNTLSTYSVDSQATGGLDAVDVAADSPRDLIAEASTTHQYETGTWSAVDAPGFTAAGFASVEVNRVANECRFRLVRFGV